MRIIRFLTGAAGLVAVLIAVPILITGAVLFKWSAGDTNTSLPTVHVSTTERAIVAENIDVFAGDRKVFLPTIRAASVTASDDDALFIGVGRTAEVRRYLDTGVGDPSEQDFWVGASEGTRASVAWDLEPGGWTAVVMNADGSAGLDATLQASVPSAPLKIAGGILVALGIGVGGVGALMIGAAWGGRRRREPHTARAPAMS